MMNIKKSLLVLALAASASFAQGVRFNSPLTMEGVDKNNNLSAVSKSMGGTTIGINNDASVMFSNPAALISLNSFQVTLGNTYWTSNSQQLQQYGPTKYYANFSLLMEGLTYLIPNTILDTNGTHTAKDSVQRPYDNIGPNWSRSKNKNLPTQIMAAIPFKVGDYKMAIGLGAVQYANMNYFMQNNNVLSPGVMYLRPFPIRLVTNDSSSLGVQWYQNIKNREGNIYGYGASFAINPMENLSFGISGMLLKGSSDDFESQLGRGKLVFFTSYFRADSVNYLNTKTGTSNYSGLELNFSGTYTSGNLTVGFSIKPPVTIERTYQYTSKKDSSGITASQIFSGTDKIVIPWRGSIGMSVSVLSNLRAAIEYELKPMASADYENGTVSSNPWKSSQLLRLGLEYSPLQWLTIRGGYSDFAEVFEQEGNPFAGDPVYSTVYSGGLGFSWQALKLNLTYQYVNIKYNDLLQDAVYLNSSKNNYLSADLSYNFSLSWFK